MAKFTTDKAYIIGLIVGGGRIDGDTLQITLPYKKWGSLDIQPDRAGGIARDILVRMNPILSATYGMEASYTIAEDWKIRCTNITEALKTDLAQLSLPSSGEMRLNANLHGVVPALKSDEHKKRFMAGLVDTVGSLAASHRRFTDEFQIISFEFKGPNFDLVAGVADILYSLDCAPDQILWNHPNQHSGTDRYYTSWKKGFKVRVSLADYMFKGTFVFESKQISASENKKKHKAAAGSKDQKIREPGRVSLHKDQHSEWLPKNVRGRLFFHNLHFNCVLGMDGGTDSGVEELLSQPEKYFCPFTCLTKGTRQEIDDIFASEKYLKQSTYRIVKVKVRNILERVDSGHSFFYGNSDYDGFPSNHIAQGIAYVIAAEQGKTNGKRVKGNYRDLLNENSEREVTIKIPDRGTGLRVDAGDFSALIGYVNDKFNKTLIDKVEGYKIIIKEPEFKECVKL